MACGPAHHWGKIPLENKGHFSKKKILPNFLGCIRPSIFSIFFGRKKFSVFQTIAVIVGKIFGDFLPAFLGRLLPPAFFFEIFLTYDRPHDVP